MYAGAICHTGGEAAAAVEGVLLSGDSTSDAQGGAMRINYGAQIAATRVTLAENSRGAAFHVHCGSAWVRGSIAWGNTEGFSGSYVDTGFNIDQSGVAGPATDPQFFAPASGDHHLRVTSPTVEACTTGPPTDLENVARPVGSGYDMGAHEGGPYTYAYLPVVTAE
jgi:hypothetical protein